MKRNDSNEKHFVSTKNETKEIKPEIGSILFVESSVLMLSEKFRSRKRDTRWKIFYTYLFGDFFFCFHESLRYAVNLPCIWMHSILFNTFFSSFKFILNTNVAQYNSWQAKKGLGAGCYHGPVGGSHTKRFYPLSDDSNLICPQNVTCRPG